VSERRCSSDEGLSVACKEEELGKRDESIGVFVHDTFCLWVVLLRYEMVFSIEIRFTTRERELNCVSKSEGNNWCSRARSFPVAPQPQRLHVEHHDSRLLHGWDCKSLREGSDAQGRWVGDLRDEEDEFQWLFGCT